MSSSGISLFATPRSLQPYHKKLIFVILAVLIAMTFALSVFGWRQSALFIIGNLFGISLYHASFGFASAYRKLFVRGEIKGILAQILMLASATLLFAPLLLSGSIGGHEVRGAVFPVGVPGAIGAFLFGVGMQLGSGCACGTLYTIGGGSSMMMLTLLTFCIGSFWSTLTSGFWSKFPETQPLSLIEQWGWLGVSIQLLIFVVLAYFLWLWGKNRLSDHQESLPNALQDSPSLIHAFLYGPWSLPFGALMLAFLNGLTLVIAGRPWGVTWGFTLWAAKIAQVLGWNPSTSEYWSQGAAAEALSRTIFADVISVMNLGIIIGAALAACLAGRLALKKPASRSAIIAALVGGLLMGYGARLAFGCNVGAYFSGIASTSLHGWLWIAFALAGTAVGVKIRPIFQLSNG
ncbi:protein of unknown function DUF395 YeeE/YedE [Rippkaea orientalis PCC 8801]|uniref:Sulphur transport domain-containing protein n=1 Tax=Rippkaea orientalis (strain PCC 8801 / RF-1) TaxID=41431 RepID=B7JV70_RIPO1|nr:YeeE/YedE family protein [Rippkaea orientalis]ACK68203.1 protein of unknown function DUF395 YeeE/YedE [Rippkaea orientalis PCC 8801]